MTKKHQEDSNVVIVNEDNIQEAVVCPEPEEGKGQTQSERISQLEQDLQSALQAKEEYYNRMLRTQADFENFRRRSRQEFEQVTCFAGEDLLKKILPVLDSLERAVNSYNEKSDNCSWQEGVDLTLRQFQNILKGEGLESVTALNQSFDPQVHEAVFQEETDQIKEPTVLEEMQKGYLYKGKLLRPALVKVGIPK